MVASAPISGRERGGGGFKGGNGVGGVRGGSGSSKKRRGARGGGKKKKGGTKVAVEKHNRHDGVFIAKRKKSDALCTKNLVSGESVYNEKRISIQIVCYDVIVFYEDGTKTEYRVWNPFRSYLAAAVLCGVDNIWIKPGAYVLYLGAASGTTVSHVSDIIGPARILALNASHFLKAGGHFMILIKANCIDCAVPAEAVFAQEVKKLLVERLKPVEQVTLEPFEHDHACVVGNFVLESALSRINIL